MPVPVIAGYVRSPFDFANKGQFAKLRPDDLATVVVQALVQRTGVKPDDIEDLIMGCAFPEGEQGMNVARMVVLLAGLPLSIGGATVNRYCGSSMQSIHSLAAAVHMGMIDVGIAAGIESMSRVPMGGFSIMPNPTMYENNPGHLMSMGDTADNVAKIYNISRLEQEEFAVESHKKAAAARKAGKLKDEIVAVETRKGTVEEDGCIRENSNLEAMAKLPLAFSKKGTVTAATSSPLTDGASATLVCSHDYAKKHKLPVLAKVKSFAVFGCAPETMGLGPIFATQKALKKAGLTVKDIDIAELNEAFSSQALACMKELKIKPDIVNIDGGAIALGHPLGATGARITGKAAALLVREDKQFALSTQCIGGGQGIATILERI